MIRGPYFGGSESLPCVSVFWRALRRRVSAARCHSEPRPGRDEESLRPELRRSPKNKNAPVPNIQDIGALATQSRGIARCHSEVAAATEESLFVEPLEAPKNTNAPVPNIRDIGASVPTLLGTSDHVSASVILLYVALLVKYSFGPRIAWMQSRSREAQYDGLLKERHNGPIQ